MWVLFQHQSKMKLTIVDQLELSKESIAKLEETFELKVYEDIPDNNKTIQERIGDSEIITVNYYDLERDVILEAPNLKYVVVPAVGYDWVDVNTCSEKGIKVLNCPTFNSLAVAEHAIGLIFGVYRKLITANRHILAGKWQPRISLMGHELTGKKLLTIGHGNIGQNITRIADAIGMHTDYANSKTTKEELKEKVQKSDIVVLCYPLTESSKGSFDKELLDSLQRDAVLINVGRGLLLDQDYLLTKLKNNEILGAGIDVFNADETIMDAREDILEFTRLDNVVATPHIGFNTKEAFQRLDKEIMEDLLSISAGSPINLVN